MKNNQILKTLKKIDFKAVIIGFLFQLTSGSILSIIPISIYVMTPLTTGISSEEIALSLNENTNFLIINFFIAVISTILGGCMSGVISKKNFTINSIFTGILIVSSLIIVMKTSPQTMLFFSITTMLATIPCAILGGSLAQKYLQKKSV